jgi:2-C-methyl-D-erythritol 4-phosphate cytidylyltransferase
MAGIGSRFGGDIPKQFLFLRGKRVYLHTVDVFDKMGLFDEIVLVCHPDWQDLVAQEVPFATLVKGAATRQGSVHLGLKSFSKKPDIVLVHDAVRPFVSERVILNNISSALLYGAVDTCIASADTLVFAPRQDRIESIPKRESYLRGQTPQTFLFDLLIEAHESACLDGIAGVSDDCQLVLRRGHPVYVVPGEERNFKITTDLDLKLASVCF